MADAPDLLAAELAAIRERAEQITSEHDEDDCDLNGDTCTGHDAERLLDLVGDLLAIHRRDHHRQPLCAGCADVWPCQDYQAISAALLGQDAGKDGQ